MLYAFEYSSDSGVVAAVNEIATLPGSNVQHSHLSRKWYTEDGVNSSTLIWDMGVAGAAIQRSVLAVLGTNLTPTATVRLRASNADPTGAAGELLDTGVVAAGVKAGYGAIYKVFAATAARYWRMDLADNAVSQLQVGRAVIRAAWQEDQALIWDWGVRWEDPSEVGESRGLQSFADELPKRRVLDVEFDFVEESAAMENLFEAARVNGRTRDVLVMPFESGNYVSEESVFGLVTVSTPVRNKNARRWYQKLTVKERL